MKTFYNEFLRIPEENDGKIGDKVMVTRLTLTVAFIVMCLTIMCLTAYAYFTCNVSSEGSKLVASNFELSVSVSEQGKQLDVTKVDGDSVVSLSSGKEYTVVITASGNAKTGFCVIQANNSRAVYHTQQMSAHEEMRGLQSNSVTFKLRVSENTVVKFITQWGTSSQYSADNTNNGEYYIVDGEDIVIDVMKQQNLLGGNSQQDENYSADTEESTQIFEETTGTSDVVTEEIPEQEKTPQETTGTAETENTTEPSDSDEDTEQTEEPTEETGEETSKEEQE